MPTPPSRKVVEVHEVAVLALRTHHETHHDTHKRHPVTSSSQKEKEGMGWFERMGKELTTFFQDGTEGEKTTFLPPMKARVDGSGTWVRSRVVE